MCFLILTSLTTSKTAFLDLIAAFEYADANSNSVTPTMNPLCAIKS